MASSGYDDDDFVDDYDAQATGEEEEELSPEDKICMDHGTEEIRKALGDDANKVTLKQIQDALWHYYYDVEKSVAYLTKTFISPTPKATPKAMPKKATEGKSQEFYLYVAQGPFANAAGADLNLLNHHPSFDFGPHFTSSTDSFPIFKKPRIPASIYFSDMPWLNTPKDRHTTFVEPERLPGGLLGGSETAPKMSKLQALAAARKKKNDEKKVQEKLAQTENGVKNLSLSDERQKENFAPSSTQNLRKRTLDGQVLQPIAIDTPAPTLEASQTEQMNVPQDTEMKIDEDEPMVMVRKYAPSAFAATLFGPAPGANMARRQDFFAMPYASSSSFSANAFSEPSPDDVVLAAQSKGSNFARAK